MGQSAGMHPVLQFPNLPLITQIQGPICYDWAEHVELGCTLTGIGPHTGIVTDG